MQVEFFDPYPHERLEPTLRSLVAGAKRIDAAIAFVTRGGSSVLREFLSVQPPQNARLVASVRYPTDLLELARLTEAMPGRVFIHTGFRFPEDERGDRGQFHSKVVLIEYEGDERSIVVGSHNWTENGLKGHNLEAGMVIRCQEGEAIVGNVRKHIQGCILRSEPFDPSRLRFYQAVQRRLHSSPAGSESEDFPGFEQISALVIHAEDKTPGGPPDPMRLFVPVRETGSSDFFFINQRVLLFLYPYGSLLGHSQPTQVPTLFDGEVTMNNTVRDAPVDQRAANCAIDDLRQPMIDLLPAGSVPPQRGERLQVVMRFNRKGTQAVPLFHSATQAPKLKLDVDFGEVNRDDCDTELLATREKDGSGHRLSEVDQQVVVPAYEAPRHLVVRCTIRVPSPAFYPRDFNRQLNHALWGLDFVTPADVPEVLFEDPAPNRVLNRYVYLVNYRFTQDALDRLQKQMKLF